MISNDFTLFSSAKKISIKQNTLKCKRLLSSLFKKRLRTVFIKRKVLKLDGQI